MWRNCQMRYKANAEYDIKPMLNTKANVNCKSQCRLQKPTRDVKPTLNKPSSKKKEGKEGKVKGKGFFL